MAPLIQDYDIIFLDDSEHSLEDASISALNNSSAILNSSILDSSILNNLSYHTIATTPLHESCSLTSPKQISVTHPSHRRVSFSGVETTHEVMHHNEYSDDEKTETWYDKESMKSMKNGAKSDAKLADQGLLVVGKDVTLRGLEGRTKEGMRRKSTNRREAYASVFSEIAFQQEVEYADEDMIADAYFLYSEPCAEEALRIGQRDELEAQAIHDNREDDLFTASFCKQAFVESLVMGGSSSMTRKLSTEDLSKAAAQHPLLMAA